MKFVFLCDIYHLCNVESVEFWLQVLWCGVFCITESIGNLFDFYLSSQSKFSGKSRARDAALNAIQSPLLDIGIERATGIVWNITGGMDLTLFEVCSSVF